MMTTNSKYLADVDTPFVRLDAKAAWNGLTDTERRYSHEISLASWSGARIIMGQRTPYAAGICDLIVAMFSSSTAGVAASFDDLKNASQVTDKEFADLLEYCALVLANLGNYRSFGDTKFIPRCSINTFEKVMAASVNKTQATKLFDFVKSNIYALEPHGENDIGRPSQGHVSNYYPDSANISDEEIKHVQAACDKADVSTLNTRLTKLSDGKFRLLVASASKDTHPKSPITSERVHVEIVRGDFSAEMAKCNHHLEQAIPFAETETRKAMLKDYIDSFASGSINDHIEGSRKWITDVSPNCESYIGFIETYVDPFAFRAEWEGFVSIVNKEASKKFTVLIDAAEKFVATLPWGKSYELDKFQKPDFTSLEVLSFATAGIPAGINLPNYLELRDSGFKNVSLQNVLQAGGGSRKPSFLNEADADLYIKYKAKTFELQVANHELLGHGSGKLLRETAPGEFNFDRESTIDPNTGKPVTSWYKAGETYGSRIQAVASSMEECRAESVAVFLCGNKEICQLFDWKSDEEVELAQYMTYLTMSHAGLLGLEFYDPKTGKHGQAHMQARLGIFKWFVQEKLVSVNEVRSSRGELEDAIILVDKDAILTRGQETIGRLLVKLQVYRATGDGIGAAEFYNELTKPYDSWAGELRDLVIKKKQPRKQFVQPVTFLQEDGTVTYKEYEESAKGMIESMIARQF